MTFNWCLMFLIDLFLIFNWFLIDFQWFLTDFQNRSACGSSCVVSKKNMRLLIFVRLGRRPSRMKIRSRIFFFDPFVHTSAQPNEDKKSLRFLIKSSDFNKISYWILWFDFDFLLLSPLILLWFHIKSFDFNKISH